MTSLEVATEGVAGASGAAPLGRRRRRSSTDSPGCTVTAYQKAHLVPVRSGFTVGAPPMTWSLIPSLGYRGPVVTP